MTRAALNEGGRGVDDGGDIRVLVAALMVGAVLMVRNTTMPTRTVLKYGLVQAVFNLTIPYVLFTFAYAEASAGFVGLLAALIPLSTAVWANWRLPDEPLTVRKAIGLFIAFAGVAFLLLSGDSGLSEGGRPALAVGLALTAVAGIGFAGTFAKQHSDEYDPTVMTGLQFGYSSVWLVIAMLAIEGVPTDITLNGWLLVIGMAVTATFIPFMLFYWLLQHVTATDVSLTGYLVPFITLTGGLLILDEELQLGIVVGFALVLVGLVIADRASRRDSAELRTRVPGVIE